MDLQLAKSLSSHRAITGFNVYRDVDTGEWFFYVLTNTSAPDDDGEPFCVARGGTKKYKLLDTLMKEVFSIIDADAAAESRPINVHYS